MGKQLNIAINPDFGQVESDESLSTLVLVKPSIRQAAVFLREPFALRRQKRRDLLHHQYQRIGAAPDYDCSRYGAEIAEAQLLRALEQDIDVALRYTQQGESIDRFACSSQTLNSARAGSFMRYGVKPAKTTLWLPRHTGRPPVY